ncbi:restriction endonuclease subunit S [Persicitalea jodogahamensis]|uniref:Type I restriction modification DNA specificity domain-containing protein n=1 Tax=Persicitalea jodogahamensis TaxID=402147 RepID=A0A8J3D607_9BACT|nr:restriction endonuclease subunit S [Persicitalea jodogahamensis]GHB79332.1 hypothetical protein GCM10007390_36660 [Persicitalea jodogahamensis]
MRKYSNYKDSGVEWIGKIPEHFNLTSIKNLVTTKVTDGPHETPEFLDEGIPFLSVESVQNGKLDFDKKRGYISPELHEVYSKKCKPQKDDIFIVKSGSTTGKSTIVETDEDFNIWSPLCIVRSDTNKITPRFAFLSIQSAYFRRFVELGWSFGTQPNIGMGVIENIKIIVPPLPEQQVIVTYLDEKTTLIDDLIKKKQEKIQLLKEKRTALIKHVVTKGLDPEVEMKDSGAVDLGLIPSHWKLMKLKFVAGLQSGNSITSDSIDEVGDYAVYGGNGLRGFTTSYTHEGHYVLIGRQGALCGNINYANGKFWASEHAVVASLKGSYETTWLGELLRMMNLNQYSLASAQPGLSVERIQNLDIPVPPYSEQQAIVTYLDEQTQLIDQTIQQEEQKIDLLKEYRQSLISEVVTGKICVLDT